MLKPFVSCFIMN